MPVEHQFTFIRLYDVIFSKVSDRVTKYSLHCLITSCGINTESLNGSGNRLYIRVSGLLFQNNIPLKVSGNQ